MTPRALIVDDEPDIRDLLGITLDRTQLTDRREDRAHDRRPVSPVAARLYASVKTVRRSPAGRRREDR